MTAQDKLVRVLTKAHKLVNTNNFQEALALLGKQKDKVAGHTEVLKIKARALTGMEHFDESLKILRDLQTTSPRDAGILASIALNFNLMKDHESAVEYAEQAVSLDPRNVGLLLNLASTYRANQMTDSAVSTLRKAESAAPGHPNVVLLLSELLIEQGAYQDALKRIKPFADSPFGAMLLLDCYCKLNWYDEAKAVAERMQQTIARQGDYFKALYCTRLQQLGDFPTIQEMLKGPAPVDSPQLLLIYIQSVDLDTTELLQLAGQLEEAGFEKEHKTALLFAISDKLFVCQENDAAFELLAKANRMLAVSDLEQQEAGQVFDKIKNSFMTWKRDGVTGTESDAPIFIVGMPRSGTTLVESILAAHSEVFAAGETQFLGMSLNGRSNAKLSHPDVVKYLDVMDGWTAEETGQMALDYLDYLKQHSSEAKHLVDKMPHNFLHLGVIRTLFPNAKIIHCTRNPVATCLSIYRQHLSGFHAYATQMEFLAEYYKKYRDLMSFWKEQVDGLDLIEISYESLVSEFEPTVRGLLADCGLAFEEQCLDFHQQKKSVITLSVAQVRDEIYRTSLKSWQGVEQHIEPLLNAFPDALD